MEALVDAITIIRAMSIAQKTHLGDELFQTQPNLLGSVIVLQRMGVSLAKIEVALELLFICYQSMKQSGLRWPLMTEDDLDKQMARHVATVRFEEGLSSAERERALAQYLDAHPEKPLLAYVTGELNKWLAEIDPEVTDNYLMLACINLVNCIAFSTIRKAAKRR